MAGLAEADIAHVGKNRQFAVDLAPRHRPVGPEAAFGSRHELSAGHRPLVKQAEQSGSRGIDLSVGHAF